MIEILPRIDQRQRAWSRTASGKELRHCLVAVEGTVGTGGGKCGSCTDRHDATGNRCRQCAESRITPPSRRRRLPFRPVGHATVEDLRLAQPPDGCPAARTQGRPTGGRAVADVAGPYGHRANLCRPRLQNLLVAGCQRIVPGCPHHHDLARVVRQTDRLGLVRCDHAETGEDHQSGRQQNRPMPGRRPSAQVPNGLPRGRGAQRAPRLHHVARL